MKTIQLQCRLIKESLRTSLRGGAKRACPEFNEGTKQTSLQTFWFASGRALAMTVTAVLCLVSCDDDLNRENYSTFTGDTVTSYCRNNSRLSMFYRIMEDSDNTALLSLYGHYTCFAPTDSAFNNYFDKYQISYNKLTKEDKKNIVFNHIIKHNATEYTSEYFQEGALPASTLGDRFLTISYSLDSLSGVYKQVIYVNKHSRILFKDNKVHNGVVHIIDKVIEPSQNTLLAVMKEQEGFKLFAKAMELTHLEDSLLGVYDMNYADPYPGQDEVKMPSSPNYKNVVPIHTRHFGYTIFAEPDQVFKAAKTPIETIEQLVAFASTYYGTEDMHDYTSRKNPLNKFISYHLLNRQMMTNTFIYQGKNTAAYAMDQRHEYYETMLHLRLMEIKAGNQINTLKDRTFVGVDESNSNIEGMNGYIHALTNILVYDEKNMTEDVLNKRIRIDVYSIPPQLTNNNIRWRIIEVQHPWTFSNDFCNDYFKAQPGTEIVLEASESWDCYQADHFKINGWYDFTLRLPPVPPGTWEIRFGYQAVAHRGIAQLYIDGKIQGIPIDLRKEGSSPDVGWVKDSETHDGGLENDKMMRNRGYMKGGKAIVNSGWGNQSLRDLVKDLRVIVGQFTFQEYDYHYFRAKNVEDPTKEFQLDYVEYCPVSFLDKETVD